MTKEEKVERFQEKKQTGTAGADRMRGIFADGDVSGREICKRGVSGSFDL